MRWREGGAGQACVIPVAWQGFRQQDGKDRLSTRSLDESDLMDM